MRKRLHKDTLKDMIRINFYNMELVSFELIIKVNTDLDQDSDLDLILYNLLRRYYQELK